MLNGIVLGPKEHKTYTIIYYVKNFNDKDQTEEDANKKFYANVRVDSITTGIYVDNKKYSRRQRGTCTVEIHRARTKQGKIYFARVRPYFSARASREPSAIAFAMYSLNLAVMSEFLRKPTP